MGKAFRVERHAVGPVAYGMKSVKGTGSVHREAMHIPDLVKPHKVPF